MASDFNRPQHALARNQRKSTRSIVKISAELLVSSGSRFKVAILDLSATGFRAQTPNHVTIGRKVYLTIPGIHALPASVTWNDREYYGCEFTRPLHTSVFEHIAREYPSLVE